MSVKYVLEKRYVVNVWRKIRKMEIEFCYKKSLISCMGIVGDLLCVNGNINIKKLWFVFVCYCKIFYNLLLC